MFKRNPRSYMRIIAEFFYPRGGWYRAAGYVIHRLRRLPDPPHRISRGIAAGVFACFTPFYGLHFVTAAGLSWLMGGNVLASLLATFFGNPLTFPLIASVSVELGSWMLGLPVDMYLPQIMGSFSHASAELWHNFMAAFTDDVAVWDGLHRFFRRVFMPYLVGGLIPGVISGLIAYALSRPVITAYQKRRIKKLKHRYAVRMAEQAAKADAASQ